MEKSAWKTYEFPMPQILGLAYKSPLIRFGFDGASVMRGQLSSVSKRIPDKAPLAYYVHYYGHRLNLVLIKATKHIPGAVDFFSLLENLYVTLLSMKNFLEYNEKWTRQRAAISKWYMRVVSVYLVRKCSFEAGSRHKTFEGDICKWNRSLCYISERITFEDGCRIC